MGDRGFAGKLIVLFAVIAAAFALAAPASAKQSKPPVFWVDLSGTAAKHPKFVYFTANSGGQVRRIKWRNWGKRKAVGKGIFRDTSPSFPGKLDQDGPARLVAWKPVVCTPEFGSKKGKRIQVYRRVKMQYSNGKGGKKWADVSYAGGALIC